MTHSRATRSLFGQHQRTLGRKHSSALHPLLWEPLATQGEHGAVPGNSYWPFHQRLMNLVTLQPYQAQHEGHFSHNLSHVPSDKTYT